MDNHQFFNARFLQNKGGAIIINDKDLTAELLASELTKLIKDKGMLMKMSESVFDDHFVHATNNIVDFTYKVIKKHKLMNLSGYASGPMDS